MFTEQWSHVVVASAVPVVVISASGLLCLAFYNRLAAIVSRLRSVQRERLQVRAACRTDQARGDAHAVRGHQRLLKNLAFQTKGIIRRARLIRLTLLCLLLAISCLIVSSLTNGIGLFWPPAFVGAAVLFATGMLSLLAGIIAAMLELKAALDVVQLESRLVSSLTESVVDLDDDPERDDALVTNSIEDD